MYDIIELNEKQEEDLRAIAKELKIEKADNLKKQDLIYKILDYQALNPSVEILEKEQKEQIVKNKRKRVRREPTPPGKKIASSDSYLNEISQSEPPEVKIEKELFPPRKEKQLEPKGVEIEPKSNSATLGLEGEVLSGSNDGINPGTGGRNSFCS